MNIIATLTTDHRNVDALFTEFEHTEPDDVENLARLRDHILRQLATHAEIEEQTLYPALREAAGEDELDDVLEALEEHHAVKTPLAELEKMKPSAERFRAKMQVVIESVRHHVEEEEGDGGLFDLARRTIKQPDAEAMGEKAELVKEAAPTRPHPWAPDQPPLNVLVGMPVAVLDRAITTARDLAEKVFRKAS